MNTVLSNNATALTVSTNTPENWPFAEMVVKVATRKVGASGITRSSVTVNRGALISGVCNEFRSSFPSIYAKRDDKGQLIGEGKDANVTRVQGEYFDKIVQYVDEFLDKRYEEFTKNDCKVSNTRFVHQASKQDVILRHTLVRDEVISLQEQKFGIGLYIGETQRQIAKIDKQATVLSEKTEERLKKLEKRLVAENNSLSKILERIASVRTIEPTTT